MVLAADDADVPEVEFIIIIIIIIIIIKDVG